MVASKGGRVATVTVGYSPDCASRLKGARYTFFVSVVKTTPPSATATSCQEVPVPTPDVVQTREPSLRRRV